MAIFHFTVKIVGRSKGKSIIAASAYLNGAVMKISSGFKNPSAIREPRIKKRLWKSSKLRSENSVYGMKF